MNEKIGKKLIKCLRAEFACVEQTFQRILNIFNILYVYKFLSPHDFWKTRILSESGQRIYYNKIQII